MSSVIAQNSLVSVEIGGSHAWQRSCDALGNPVNFATGDVEEIAAVAAALTESLEQVNALCKSMNGG